MTNTFHSAQRLVCITAALALVAGMSQDAIAQTRKPRRASTKTAKQLTVELGELRQRIASLEQEVRMLRAEVESLRKAKGGSVAPNFSVPTPSVFIPNVKPPIVIQPGKALKSQFANVVILKGLKYSASVENGVAYAEADGEIGIVIEGDNAYKYKIRGVGGKLLRFKQTGALSPAGDIWLDQPYEVLDRQGNLLYRYTPAQE